MLNLQDYEPLVNKYATFAKVNGYTKDDIKQELLMVAYKCINNYDSSRGAKFETYLIGSFKHKIKELRKEFRHQPPPLIEEYNNWQYAFIEEYDADKEHMIEMLVRAYEELPRGEWNVNYHLNGLSMQNIADASGVSRIAVYKAITKNDEILKERYKKVSD